MSDRFPESLIPDFGDYSLEALLDEYRAAGSGESIADAPEQGGSDVVLPAEEPSSEDASAQTQEDQPTAVFRPQSAEAIAERSRRIVMSALGETLRQYQKTGAVPSLDEEFPEPPAPEDTRTKEDQAAPAEKPEGSPAPEAVQTESPPDEPGLRPQPVEKPRPQVTVGENGIITLRFDRPVEGIPAEEPEPESEPAPEPESEPMPIQAQETEQDGEKAQDETQPPENERPGRSPKPTDSEQSADAAPQKPPRPAKKKTARSASFKERFLAPAVRIVATRLARRQQQTQEAANWPEPVDIRETPELSPKKAAKYYNYILRSLRVRCRIALVLTLVLTWIGLSLPMAGMLGVSVQYQAGVSLIFTLTVMITALDIVTAGLRQLFDLHPGAESLAVMSAILSCVDAILVLLGYGSELPFCAIGAAALTAALWGERMSCTALRRTFLTAAASQTPSVLTCGVQAGKNAECLMRGSRGSVRGIVRRSEQQDLCRTAYAVASPILLGASLVLAIVASLGGNGGHFLHTLSALLSVSTSFAAFFSFPLPYMLASRRLRNSGAALAGSAASAEIGKLRRIVITDEDLFPPGTMKFSEMNVASEAAAKKVVGYTTSLLRAAGCGSAALFNEFVLRHSCDVPEVQEFRCHEGGGLSGLVDGEHVLVGSAGFMNLMGIRLPQNMTAKNAVCTAVGDELMAVFVIDYIPLASVQEALLTLLRGRTHTIFAIRDFNITPLMIRQLFRIPTDRFTFPAFRDRYRIAAEAAREDAPIDAVISRNGMLPMAEAAEVGRKLYSTSRISTIISLTGAAIGLVIMFLLCRVGSYDTASVGNVLSFMLLWALPVVILSFGQNR